MKPRPVGLRPAEGVGEVVGGAALVVGHRHGAVPLVVPGHECNAMISKTSSDRQYRCRDKTLKSLMSLEHN